MGVFLSSMESFTCLPSTDRCGMNPSDAVQRAAVALKQRMWSQFVLPKVKSFHQMLMLCGDTTMQLRPLGPSGPVVHCIQSGAEMAKMFRNNPNKLLRFNPLDAQHLPGPLGKFMSFDDSLMQVVDGIKKSLFFELQGPDREQLKSHMVTFGKRFSDQKVLDRMYKDMRKHFETFSMEGGGKSKNLFDVIQRTIVAVLLSEMFGCSLPDDVTPARLQELANKVFGALPNGPPAKDWKMLKRVVDHMTAQAVEGSMAWHLRDTYEGKPEESPEEKEETIRSNMLVLLLIGAQSMANGAYWLTLCLQDPDRLSRLRRGDGKLADVLVEEMRRHPPSSPILMPYKVISAFTHCGMDFREGDYGVISPPWQHMTFPKPHEHQEDRFSEDLAAHRQKSGCPFWKGSGPVPGKEVEAAERVLFDRLKQAARLFTVHCYGQQRPQCLWAAESARNRCDSPLPKEAEELRYQLPAWKLKYIDPRYDEYPTAVNENWVTVHSHTAAHQKLFYPPGANLSAGDFLQQLQTVGSRLYGTCALFQWCPQARRMYQLPEWWPLQRGSEVTIASVKRQAPSLAGSALSEENLQLRFQLLAVLRRHGAGEDLSLARFTDVVRQQGVDWRGRTKKERIKLVPGVPEFFAEVVPPLWSRFGLESRRRLVLIVMGGTVAGAMAAASKITFAETAVPGIVRIPGRSSRSLGPWGHMCLLEDGKVILVDVPYYSPDLAAEVRRQGPGGLSHILLTHDDFVGMSDHGIWKKNFPEVVRVAHVADCKYDDLEMKLSGTGPWDLGVAGLTAYHAPGHSEGSVFYASSKLSALFTGDSFGFWSAPTGFPGFARFGRARQAASLRGFARHAPFLPAVLPSHGDPMYFENAAQREEAFNRAASELEGSWW
ncbi:nfnB [Symbiodinium microadriaticum]|nr:nfnB [Symbiodinium microadriaticum]